ncbi:MAG: ABC transporter ATP-binding protein [Euryarchaeota archaeon]|nr:ABC transporter ATP-binding protein [Euryarchaeota archaeon]
MQNIIETSGITKIFDGRVAVDDLNIKVKKGEVLGFLGPNGAGKTTTIRILSGIISPTKGSATVAGFRTDEDAEKLHEIIGLLTETPGFYERLSAKRNLEFFAKFYSNIDVDFQVNKYLKLMELWDRRDDKVGNFSKGMKQRLALARALIHEPEIVFLDEPTAGLDPEVSIEVHKLIIKLKEEKRTVFLCTHNLEEAELLSDRIALFKTNLVALDTASNLRNQLFKREVIIEMESVDNKIIEAVETLNFVQGVNKEDKQLVIELTEFDKNRPDLVESIIKAGGRIQSVFERKHSVEEIYMTLIKEEDKEKG